MPKDMHTMVKPMAMFRFAKHEHERVSRMIGYALALGVGDFDTWAGAALVLRARLEPKERGALAVTALRSLDLEDARRVADMALERVS